MGDEDFGFDAFVAKWVPPPPPWAEAPTPRWLAAATEAERREAYRDSVARADGEGDSFSPRLTERVRREAADGRPLLDVLAGLLEEAEVAGPESLAALVQRVFGVPPSRARFVSSWHPSNRGPEARRVLERVALCIADARRAGLWSPPGKTGSAAAREEA